jgi:hypothetical protein
VAGVSKREGAEGCVLGTAVRSLARWQGGNQSDSDRHYEKVHSFAGRLWLLAQGCWQVDTPDDSPASRCNAGQLS